MKTLWRTVALVAAVAIPCASLTAQDLDAQMAELRNRISALEVENHSFRQSPGRGPQLMLDNASPDDSVIVSQMEARIARLETQLSAVSAQSQAPEWQQSEWQQIDDDWVCPSESEDEPRMNVYWHHGLEARTSDGKFRVHVGGRTQLDAGWFDADQNVQDFINRPYEDGADFRRGRLRVDGTMYETIDWAVEYDFFNGAELDGDDRAVTGPTDLWVTFTEIPWVGNVRVGNQKPAIGFEHLVSSRFLPFMERSYNQDTFYGGVFNGFWPGIAIFDSYGGEEQIGTYNLGIFKPTDNVFAAITDEAAYSAVARITRLLWYECDGAELLHVGGSVKQRTTNEGRIVFRTRDAIRTGLASEWPVPATTGDIFGDDAQYYNGELVAVNGPWTFQSEYLVSFLQDAAPILGGVVQPSVGTVMYHGGYAQVLYFITGEHDQYNKLNGAFDRVIPHENYHPRGGIGAWQVGARYNYLDLNDEGLDGGVLHNLTFGTNWFLNPNLKVQFNYMLTHRDAPLPDELGDGWINGWGTRLAWDF